MPISLRPWSVRQICTCVQQIRDQLSANTQRVADAALNAVTEDALSLTLIKLSAKTVVFIRRDGTYICPVESAAVPGNDCAELPRWLAYRSEPSIRPLADTLDDFGFFEDLSDHMSEIDKHNAELALQLRALQVIHHSFRAGLSGDELTVNSAVAIAHGPYGSVRLELVLDDDELHPEALLLPGGQRQNGCTHNFVLLGNALVLHPSSLVRLHRLA